MELSRDNDPVINEKMKKNLVYVSIFSIIMFFAGLSSAYLVLMGDSIWVKAAMPNAFWWSTAVIFLSSLSFIFAIYQVKKNNIPLLKVFMATTFLLGLIFVYFAQMGIAGVILSVICASSLRIIILLILGAFQGVLGWYMVYSGLINNPYVSHYRLAAHFITAIGVMCYILWIILELSMQNKIENFNKKLFNI